MRNYDEVYLNEERADLPLNMSLLESSSVSYSVLIDNNKELLKDNYIKTWYNISKKLL